MKYTPWNIFTKFVAIISIPAVIAIFYFSGDEHFGWISNVIFAILLIFGFIGGVRGFTKYVLKNESVTFLKLRIRK